MIGDKSIKEGVLAIKLEFAHLTAEAEQKVISNRAIDVHQKDDDPSIHLIVKEGRKGPSVQP